MFKVRFHLTLQGTSFESTYERAVLKILSKFGERGT